MTEGAAVEIASIHCNACGQDFTSGAQAPQCLRCRSTNVTRTGIAQRVPVPEPVPAGTLPTDEQMRSQAAAAVATTSMLTYRCPVCGWTERWPAAAEAPASITTHERSHPPEM